MLEFYRIPTNLQLSFYLTAEQALRPLAIRVGILKSDLREGLLKFYNKNAFDAVDILKSSLVK